MERHWYNNFYIWTMGVTVSCSASPAGWHDDDGPKCLDPNGLNANSMEECDVCSSHWWNADGKVKRYQDSEIGANYWNHRGSLVLSIFLQISWLTFLAYDCAIYLILYWGNEKQLLRLLSYSTYLGNITAIPVICLFSNLRNMSLRSRVSCFSATTALHPRYLVKRLQYLRPTSGCIRRPFLFLCFTWPFCNSLFRAFIFIFLVSGKGDYHTHDNITICTNGINTVMFGCFCYLISILRESINKQLQLDIVFLQKHIGNVDMCRRRLAESLDEYGSLCSMCAVWMIWVMTMNSLAFATHISWNYILYSGKGPSITLLETSINIMIWSEHFMFLILPPMAIGGIDLHNIWEDFLTRISEIRCDMHHNFWNKISKFVTQEYNPFINVVNLTLLCSVISLYMALKVDDQNTLYWGGDNITPSTVIPPS